ncbi:M14 family metallopeptidase [Ornithinibacillus xuwenensis]|uniref:M14 family zinc carboxypeptidase n=1 Tax=Ornithinibacillus xuwenensis TaxID=3144668 RepID=A0ABU9XD98_9BACI
MDIYVRSGDSMWLYSQLFQVPLELIEESNSIFPSSQLTIGQRVRIPGYELTNYTVKPNDTLWKIASSQNLSVEVLLRVNTAINPTNLQIGQTILLPRRVTSTLISDVSNYTYDKMVQDIQRLTATYPFIRTNTIAQSVLGKDLIELQIGKGNKQVHVNGSFHANEWITTPVIMRFLNEYALSITNNEPIRGLLMLPYFNTMMLSAVPMVNPDGVNLVINGPSAAGPFRNEVLEINNRNTDFSEWKANIRGVDLNNQYPARWETEAARKPTTPQSRDFPGYQPLTEPEAVAMAELTGKRNFQRMNALHTQGEVIYWGFEGLEPPEAETIVNEYARVSGYNPIRYIDSYAGYKDWFILVYRRPGYTIELGTGINPLPISQFSEIYQESLGVMLANLYL